MEGGIHVSIAAEKLTEWMGIPITNTLVMSWVVLLFLVFLAVLIKRNITMVPGRFQTAIEFLIGGMYHFVFDTLENERLAKKLTPLLLAMFLFILIGNWLEFFPGVESIVYHGKEGGIPLLKGMNTDLNNTLAFAIIAFVAIETAGIHTLGFFTYIGKFINVSSPIAFFVGILELLSEVIRLVSFSFRLFGNIFAGSMLLLITTALAPYVVPAPFMIFEVFVGLIQAAVFALLTLFFIKLAIMKSGH